jgi:hypothetical protein
MKHLVKDSMHNLMKNPMNSPVKQFAILPLIMVAGLAHAAPDVQRIHKDVTVMSTIINGAFEADDTCKNCKPKIETSYLANQGAVFTVRANSWKNFQFGDVGEGFSFIIPPSEPNAVRRVEITEMVGDILNDVGVAMNEVSSHIELSLDGLNEDNEFIEIDSAARRDLRDLNRERREMEYQRREYEIELIHADAAERTRIEKKIAEIEQQTSQMEARQVELSKVYEAQKRERDLAREARREKAREASEKHLAQVEDIVLRSLCDYGATLKNIPDDEHVSIIFERKSSEKQRVYVIKMNDVTNCKDLAALRSKATNYLF